MDYKDYYATLGVSKSASQEEIQRAYRKLARKYHPDINKAADAESRFKEINEAYEVLKDGDRRSKYDRFGSAWKQAQRTGAPPPGFEEIFSQFGFGGPAGAQGFPGGTRIDFDLGGGGFSSFFETLFGGLGRAHHTGFGRSAPRPGRGEDHHSTIAVALEDAFQGATLALALRVPEYDAAGRLTQQARFKVQ